MVMAVATMAAVLTKPDLAQHRPWAIDTARKKSPIEKICQYDDVSMA